MKLKKRAAFLIHRTVQKRRAVLF